MGLSIHPTSLKWSPAEGRLTRPMFLSQCPIGNCFNILLPVLFLIILSSHPFCWGQTTSTGALIGEVLDPSGRAIAHASVKATDPDMAVSRSTMSDDEGQFTLALLPPGSYQLAVAKEGYSQTRFHFSSGSGYRKHSSFDSVEGCWNHSKH